MPVTRRETPRATFTVSREDDEVSIPEPTVEPIPSAELTTPVDADALGLGEFVAEDSLPKVVVGQSGSQRRWMAAAAGAFLVVTASIGAPAWYARARAVQAQEVDALLPPPPAHTLSQPAVHVPQLDATVLQSLQSDAAPTAAAVAVPAPRNTAVKTPGGYAILVASFQNRDRAERLVDELVEAGYGARAVEREGGPTGRLVLVQISGYASAIDVQRDLQRVRALPGGYSDARVVEQD